MNKPNSCDVDELIAGIHKLDRASREISAVVGRVVRVLYSPEEKLLQAVFHKPVLVDAGYWHWRINEHGCSLHFGSRIIYSSNTGFKQPPLKEIMKIRKNLQRLVDITTSNRIPDEFQALIAVARDE